MPIYIIFIIIIVNRMSLHVNDFGAKCLLQEETKFDNLASLHVVRDNIPLSPSVGQITNLPLRNSTLQPVG
jgi:hypothetical protein